MYPTDLCWETGKFTDDCCCDFCEHREECSGYDKNDDDDDWYATVTNKTVTSAHHDIVTTITPLQKNIVVFIPALDVEVDVKRNPDASVQNGSVPEVGDIATVQIVLEDGDYTAATFVPQQDIREDIPVTDDDLLLLDDDDEELALSNSRSVV